MYLYNTKQDQTHDICQLTFDHLLPRSKGGNVRAKAAIAYQELLQNLLTFQLQGHQRFLDYFVGKFNIKCINVILIY